VLAGLGVDPIGVGGGMVVLAGLKRPERKMTDVPAGHRLGKAVLVRPDSGRRQPRADRPSASEAWNSRSGST